MAKRIIWSKNALQDKMGILEYWNRRLQSKEYSKRLNEKLIEITQLIKEFPKVGKKSETPNIRYMIKDKYEVYYQIKNDRIHILHIWDARRNPNDLNIK